jgi:aldose 1-epimerase
MANERTMEEAKKLLPDRKLFHLPYKIDGKQTDLFFLKNKKNMHAAITNYGGRIVSLLVPDRNNQLTDIIIGPGSIDRFRASKERYFGATIGRFGNRIAKGKFKIDDKEYTLSRNENDTTLHGGVKGFQDVVWDATQENESTLRLSYLSKDGEEGFPGNLNVSVLFTLTDNNELKIDYEAVCDQKTIVNLTNHAFFNLAGQNEVPIGDHLLQINADQYTPVDNELIPLGNLEAVAGTEFDFRELTPIHKNITKFGIVGYDINFVLNKNHSALFDHAVTVISPETGIQMNILTQEPCLLFYSGQGMKSENVLKNGKRDAFSSALVLETHQFPDAPNQKDFPSSVLKPGETFRTSSVYQFKINTHI